MPRSYEHTQTAYPITISLIIGIILVTFLMVLYGPNGIVFLVLLILLICLWSFSSLTVTIDERALKIQFGKGPIQKTFHLQEISSCQIVRNPWYYGWGIHWTPHGWLFNVSGHSAVEIRMKNRRSYRIGTDMPDELERAIQRALHRLEGK